MNEVGPATVAIDYRALEPFWATTVPIPDDHVVRRETMEVAFLAAIQHLPPSQRAVLLLRDVEGWSAKDVAEALTISTAAVKSRLQRGRATLRERLPEQREEWSVQRDVTPAESLPASTCQRLIEREGSSRT